MEDTGDAKKSDNEVVVFAFLTPAPVKKDENEVSFVIHTDDDKESWDLQFCVGLCSQVSIPEDIF